jgi:hypothetical protein
MHGLKTIGSAFVVAALLIIGADYTAIAATGHSFILGESNKADNVTTLARTNNGAALRLTANNASAAPLVTNAHGRVRNLNADELDGIDSSGFLRSTQLKLSQQRGWLQQAGDTGTVNTYANLQALEGSGTYYLPLTTPNIIGTQAYYLASVEVCYNMFSGGQMITTTKVLRSTVNNDVDQTFTDATQRTSAYPTTECYKMPVNDSAAPTNSVYTLELDLLGSARIVRVTTIFNLS